MFNKSLDDEYFPQYVVMPVDYWFHVCDRFGIDIEMYSNDFLQSFEKSDFFSRCKTQVEGKLSWNDWGACSASCGGGAKIKIAHSCVPEYAVCNDIPIIEEPCNPSICPDMPSTYLPPGTIISWVPKPNLDAPDSVYFDDDTWIRCDGAEKCKQGRFVGQFCSDLSDRVLVGAGSSGDLLELKDASFPDHAHKHRHTGSKNYLINYKRGPKNNESKKKKKGSFTSSQVSKDHHHDNDDQTSVNINFADMTEEAALISNFKNPNSKITKSSGENELYSPHMRVTFMFKCY